METPAAAAASKTRRLPWTLTALEHGASREGWISQARWTTASAPANSSSSGARVMSAATNVVLGACQSVWRRARPTISVTAGSAASAETTLVPTLPVAP